MKTLVRDALVALGLAFAATYWLIYLYRTLIHGT